MTKTELEKLHGPRDGHFLGFFQLIRVRIKWKTQNWQHIFVNSNKPVWQCAIKEKQKRTANVINVVLSQIKGNSTDLAKSQVPNRASLVLSLGLSCLW